MAQQVSLRAPSFRVLALLLVLGGGCLGLFAGSLLAGSRGAAPTVKTDPYMDGQVADYVRRFGLSRIAFREMALSGMIPGVRKASW